MYGLGSLLFLSIHKAHWRHKEALEKKMGTIMPVSSRSWLMLSLLFLWGPNPSSVLLAPREDVTENTGNLPGFLLFVLQSLALSLNFGN